MNSAIIAIGLAVTAVIAFVGGYLLGKSVSHYDTKEMKRGR